MYIASSTSSGTCYHRRVSPFFSILPSCQPCLVGKRGKREGKAESRTITRCKDLVVGMCDWVGFGLAGLLHALSMSHTHNSRKLWLKERKGDVIRRVDPGNVVPS